MNSGIYKIEHITTGRVYVGSACDIERRISRHKTELRNGTHCNQKLLRAWTKYGESAFVFAVVEAVARKEDLVRCEQQWIDAMNSVSRGFNICPTAGSTLGTKKNPSGIEKTASAHRGMKRSAETRAKIRDARLRQQPLSLEGRARISEALRRRIITDETRAKLSAAIRGRKMSPEAVEKNRLSHIGIRKTPETIAKIVAARAGYKHSMETRKKMSEWQIGRKMSPEAILKGVLARRGYRASAETKAKISAAGKGRPKSAATRAKMSASQKRRFAKSVAARALNKMEAQHAH